METATDLAAIFEQVGARGYLHARDVDGSRETGLDADDDVVLASVFKIPIALTYAIEVASGRLDPRARTTVLARHRTGGVGTGGCADDVTLSGRDLALLMMTLSDNAATDALLELVSLEAVNATLRRVGAGTTSLIGNCRDLFDSIAAELGGEFPSALAAATPDQVRALSVVDPTRTTSGTAREITGLLSAIWRDAAGPASACASVRSAMEQQIWPHRLASGFPDDVIVAGKTGTMPFVRNEAGVITYPDGHQYAVAVFTVADQLAERQPTIDRAIGTAARAAVESLRA